MPEFIFEDDTEQDYQTAGEGKWVSFPQNDQRKAGAFQERDIKIIDVDWETVGSSIKVVVEVTEEGADFGKDSKLVFGLKKTEKGTSGLFKGKPLYKALTGEDMPFTEDGKPKIDPAKLIGKTGVGRWTMQRGTKGGEGLEETFYPKLTDILPSGSKTEVTSLV